MNDELDADQIRREMAAARAALARDAHAAAADARVLTDWRHHVRAHPWLLVGSAAAAGYLLAPRGKTRAAAPVAEARASHVSNGRASESHAAEASQAKSLAATALGLAASFLIRQSLNYATRQGLKWIELRSGRRDAAADTFHSQGTQS